MSHIHTYIYIYIYVCVIIYVYVNCNNNHLFSICSMFFLGWDVCLAKQPVVVGSLAGGLRWQHWKPPSLVVVTARPFEGHILSALVDLALTVHGKVIGLTFFGQRNVFGPSSIEDGAILFRNVEMISTDQHKITRKTHRLA